MVTRYWNINIFKNGKIKSGIPFGSLEIIRPSVVWIYFWNQRILFFLWGLVRNIFVLKTAWDVLFPGIHLVTLPLPSSLQFGGSSNCTRKTFLWCVDSGSSDGGRCSLWCNCHCLFPWRVYHNRVYNRRVRRVICQSGHSSDWWMYSSEY